MQANQHRLFLTLLYPLLIPVIDLKRYQYLITTKKISPTAYLIYYMGLLSPAIFLRIFLKKAIIHLVVEP